MNNQPHIVPRIAITGVATGLLMMAFFTSCWAIIGHVGLNGRDNNIEIILFALLAIAFIIMAVYLFSISKRFPEATTEADIQEGKRSGKWFGIIFGGEGLIIFIAVNVVINIGHADLTMPVIALVVGLHFYPIGWLFKRTIDYYLATWASIIAVLAIVFTLNKTLQQNDMFAFVGIGLAIATSCYGLYMIFTGRRLAKMVVDAGA